MKFKLFLLFGLLSFVLCAQDFPPAITVEGEQIYCADSPINIVTSVSITDSNPEDDTLQEVFIQIAEGYEFGSDVLFLTGNHPNISSNWNPNQGQLELVGPASFSDFETAIESVQFQTSQTTFTEDRQFSINLGNANYLPSTGHYYFYVSSVGITWTEARDAAASQNYFGLTGYLATITSEEEAQLTGEQSSGTGWIGASDADTEGTWRWETGPEAGTIFWQGAQNGNPVNGEFSFWNDNEPNNFGNEDYAHITDPSIGNIGSWNDLPNEGDVPSSPYHPQGYIVEFGGLPNEPEINLSANSTIIMPRIFSEDVMVCGENEVTITISSNIENINWYASETGDVVINTGLTYNVTLFNDTTYWLEPDVAMCNSSITRVPLNITVNEVPLVNDITIFQCEDEVIDGISIFNLSAYSDAILAGDLSSFSIDFFEDMNLSIPIIESDNYTNTINSQNIYALVTNLVTQCTSVAEVTLYVNTEPTESVTLEGCDNFEETGIITFNLSEAENLIQINEGFDKVVQGYYATYNDALLQQSQLSNNFTNTEAYNQTIYARLVQNGSCYSIVEVNLSVETLPNLSDDEVVYYCLNSYPQTITISGGVIDDVPNNFYYNWSTGETTINIEINEPGNYTVEVTRPNGCTNQRTITVLPSNIATIETIDVMEVSENNTVAVFAVGEGTYLYALDNENGPYQEQSTFENVSAGVHTVYVKDIKADCGVVLEDVSVLGFPKFFTPNGDTINDTWQLKGFSSQFPFTATVKIFNRYGKLLTILNASNTEWDGRYRGNLQPSDDYWFEANFTDGRTFKGHFTLKR